MRSRVRELARAALGEPVRLHPLALEYLVRRCGAPPPRALLALRWRVSPTSVSRRLRGRVAMPRDAAEELASLAGVPLWDLLEPPAGGGAAGGTVGAREPVLMTLTPILLECVRAELDHALGHALGRRGE